MNLLFGLLFLIGGLALAVLLGITLYRSPREKESAARAATAPREGPEAA